MSDVDRFLWMDGACVEWAQARVHVWDEVCSRGASVFEGLHLVWDAERERHAAIAFDQHFQRLLRSARLTDIPVTLDEGELWTVLCEASRRFLGRDVYARPTLYARTGRTSLTPGASGGAFVGAFPIERPANGRPVGAIVSSYAHYASPVSPAAKAGGGYLGFRLVEREKVLRSAEAAIILDDRGCVAESEASAVIAATDDGLIIPSLPHTALDSVTRRIMIELAGHRGVPIEHRPVHRTELDTVALLLTGTLFGVRPVAELDGLPTGQMTARGLLDQLSADYAALCEGSHVLAVNHLRELDV